MFLVTYDLPKPLEDYLACLPEKTRAARSLGTPKAGKKDDASAHDFPWIAELDLREGFAERVPPIRGDAAEAAAAPWLPDALDDELFDEGMQALDAARLAMAAEPEASHEDFGTRVLGGPWLLKTKGIPFDAIQGYGRGEATKQFCIRRNIPKTIRFDYQLYGGDACGVMARAWCHRLQWLFNLELSIVVSPLEAFALNDLRDYEEPSEFIALAESSTGKIVARIEQIRALPFAD